MIKTICEKNAYTYGISDYIMWDFEKSPHGIIFGSTGSGKTYLLKLLLARIGISIPESELVICDYKSDEDFSFAESCEHLYRFHSCMDGLLFAVRKLEERQQKTDTSRTFFLLVFDEWASFLGCLEKKQADAAKANLATLLMLGRSFHIHVIISQQRVDAKYFDNARDNFSAVFGLGALSKESVDMMFSEYKEEVVRSHPQGCGSLVMGNKFYEIVVPRIRYMEKVEEAIRAALSRSSHSAGAGRRTE